MGPTDRYMPTSGANPGEAVILTKGAGIEASAVLATDFRDAILDAGVESTVVDRAAAFFDDVSVLPESAVLAPVATAMHDPTEGGVLNGLVELACASDVSIGLDSADVPIRDETRHLCAAMGVDPLRILGSGAMLATVPAEESTRVISTLESEGIDARVIATVSAADDPADVGVHCDGRQYRDSVRDDMYDLWE
jgi:hydrogenase expression/formation protein HypE